MNKTNTKAFLDPKTFDEDNIEILSNTKDIDDSFVEAYIYISKDISQFSCALPITSYTIGDTKNLDGGEKINPPSYEHINNRITRSYIGISNGEPVPNFFSPSFIDTENTTKITSYKDLYNKEKTHKIQPSDKTTKHHTYSPTHIGIDVDFLAIPNNSDESIKVTNPKINTRNNVVDQQNVQQNVTNNIQNDIEELGLDISHTTKYSTVDTKNLSGEEKINSPSYEPPKFFSPSFIDTTIPNNSDESIKVTNPKINTRNNVVDQQNVQQNVTNNIQNDIEELGLDISHTTKYSTVDTKNLSGEEKINSPSYEPPKFFSPSFIDTTIPNNSDESIKVTNPKINTRNNIVDQQNVTNNIQNDIEELGLDISHTTKYKYSNINTGNVRSSTINLQPTTDTYTKLYQQQKVLLNETDEEENNHLLEHIQNIINSEKNTTKQEIKENPNNSVIDVGQIDIDKITEKMQYDFKTTIKELKETNNKLYNQQKKEIEKIKQDIIDWYNKFIK